MLRSLTRTFTLNPRPALRGISSRNESSVAEEEQLPDDFVRGKSKSIESIRGALRLYDPHVVDIVAGELKADIASDRFILEANPGPGLLTRRLLDLGCNRLHLFEDRHSPFGPVMNQIAQENPDRVKMIKENLLRMAGIRFCDKLNETDRMASCLEGLPCRSWDEEPSATAFLAVPLDLERRFLSALLYAFAQKSMIFASGRVDLLILARAEAYEHYTFSHSRKVNSYASVLYGLFFDNKIVTSVSSQPFRAQMMRRPAPSHPPGMILFRLTPKTDIFQRFPEPRRVEEFVFFVKQCYLRGATMLYLNQLIPHIVRDILLKTRWSGTELTDVDLDTKINKLGPCEVLRIFEILSQHELYPSCPLAGDLAETLPTLQLGKRRH